MGNIDCWGENAGRLALCGHDERMLKLTKSRVKSDCGICDKRISAKSYCLGGGCYTKICLNCYEKFLNQFILSIEGYKAQAIALIENIKSKSSKLTKNNILAKVEDRTNEDND